MSNQFGGVDMTSNMIFQSGTPCVIKFEIVNNYDYHGRVVKAGNYSTHADDPRMQLDLRDLPGGMYIAEIASGTLRWREKLVLH